jgi:transposase
MICWGMSKKTPPLDWRDGRRRRAWELKQQGWKQTAIAAALGVTPGAVSQWLKRARTQGVEALRGHPAAGPIPRLTAAQRAHIPGLLARGAPAWGFVGEVWTCKRVAEVLRRTFGVSYHPAHVYRLLQSLEHSFQRPVDQASQRDEEAIAVWWRERWPALKKKQPPRDARSSG